jgi:two-component system, chemotaxis family, protein-glutamate methylesterase/glutaminase
MSHETAGCNKIVVMGASAGGIEAIARILAEIPPNIAAAFFVVLHLNASVPSMLATVLGRRTRLNVVAAQEGMEIRCGTVYTASPDRHLLIEGGVTRLGRGPRENNFRPAVDPLFRSAAASYGADVIGIVLSGNLDDGTAGLMEIKRAGGTAIVQDPEDALYQGMPASALQEVRSVDFVLPAGEVANAVTKLAGLTEPGIPMPAGRTLALDIAIGGERPLSSDEREAAEGGEQSSYGCPSCGGVLWEKRDGDMVRYRCRVGHMFSDEALLAAQTEGLELALWTALRALEEAAEQSAALSARMRSRGHVDLAERFARQQDDAVKRATIVREAISFNQASSSHIQEVGRLTRGA